MHISGAILACRRHFQNKYWVYFEYQPSGEGGTRSPPATLDRSTPSMRKDRDGGKNVEKTGGKTGKKRKD